MFYLFKTSAGQKPRAKQLYDQPEGNVDDPKMQSVEP